MRKKGLLATFFCDVSTKMTFWEEKGHLLVYLLSLLSSCTSYAFGKGTTFSKYLILPYLVRNNDINDRESFYDNQFSVTLSLDLLDSSILSNIERTRTLFFEHCRNSNGFISIVMELEHPFLGFERSNIELPT